MESLAEDIGPNGAEFIIPGKGNARQLVGRNREMFGPEMDQPFRKICLAALAQHQSAPRLQRCNYPASFGACRCAVYSSFGLQTCPAPALHRALAAVRGTASDIRENPVPIVGGWAACNDLGVGGHGLLRPGLQACAQAEPVHHAGCFERQQRLVFAIKPKHSITDITLNACPIL